MLWRKNSATMPKYFFLHRPRCFCGIGVEHTHHIEIIRTKSSPTLIVKKKPAAEAILDKPL